MIEIRLSIKSHSIMPACTSLFTRIYPLTLPKRLPASRARVDWTPIECFEYRKSPTYSLGLVQIVRIGKIKAKSDTPIVMLGYKRTKRSFLAKSMHMAQAQCNAAAERNPQTSTMVSDKERVKENEAQRSSPLVSWWEANRAIVLVHIANWFKPKETRLSQIE